MRFKTTLKSTESATGLKWREQSIPMSYSIRKKLIVTWAVEQVRQTQRPPDQCLLYGAWKVSRCNLRSPQFQNFPSFMCTISYLADECLESLDWNTWNRLWNICVKQTGPLTLYYRFFCPFALCQT